MTKVPDAQAVVRAIRAVRLAARKSLKKLNQVAGRRMARGDYAQAEALAAKGKELRQFDADVEGLLARWRDVCGKKGAGGKAARSALTPLWHYYQPILQALSAAGGEARRVDLEPEVERLMAATLTPGDRSELARGRERWRVMIRRAHKPLVAEGWLVKHSGLTWKITEAGKRAAEKALTKEPPSKK